jgi:RsiW-degrading membrane proteinase PrsW (M82 family)
MNAPRTSLPRWGVQASIIQPSKPAFWLFAILLAIGGYLFIDEESILSQLPTALAVSWGLVLLYAIPVFLLVYRLDLFEREPRLMLVAALLWGGVIATSLAGYANDAWLSVLGKVAPADFVSDWGAAVVAPVTEETLKLTGVIVLFLIASTEFDGVMDGFVYGALIGLGFTVTEDVSYFIRATAAFGGADQTGPVIDTFLIRVVAGGLYSHVLFAGLTGMGFAYFVTRTSETMSKRLLVFAALVAAGAGAHFVWDSPWMISILDTASATDKPSTVQWIEYGAVKGLPFLILLVLMVLFATRSESSTFRARDRLPGQPVVSLRREVGRAAGPRAPGRSAHRAAPVGPDRVRDDQEPGHFPGGPGAGRPAREDPSDPRPDRGLATDRSAGRDGARVRARDDASGGSGSGSGRRSGAGRGSGHRHHPGSSRYAGHGHHRDSSRYAGRGAGRGRRSGRGPCTEGSGQSRRAHRGGRGRRGRRAGSSGACRRGGRATATGRSASGRARATAAGPDLGSDPSRTAGRNAGLARPRSVPAAHGQPARAPRARGRELGGSVGARPRGERLAGLGRWQAAGGTPLTRKRNHS